MTPSMSKAIPKEGLAGAAAEWDNRRPRVPWSSARVRAAARQSAERKPLMPSPVRENRAALARTSENATWRGELWTLYFLPHWNAGHHPFYLLRFQGYSSPGQRQPHAGRSTEEANSLITMAAHAPLAVPHAAAGPRLVALLLTPAATAPSVHRARCPRGYLVKQQRRMRHLLPAAAAAKPGAIGIWPTPSLTLVASIMLFGSVKATSITSSARFAGSAAEAAEAPAEGLARSLQGVEVFDLSGNAVPVVDLWRDRKAVVAFARHFGSVTHYVPSYLSEFQDAMEAAGVSLVLIGPGTVEQAGLKIIQLYREGYRQDWELSFEKNTRTKGGWYQGGLLVAGPGINDISYIHKDKEAGDDPEMEDVLKACCS
ncbi:hypothetical protein ACQ4PT_048175 [Festuca glaucescens]